MVKSIIKEIILLILLLLAIILGLGVLFYDYIPTNKTIPSVAKYSTAEVVQTELDEKITQDENVLVTYEITPSDLKTLEKTKDYEKGKSNPFSTYETVNGEANGEVGTEGKKNETNTNNEKTNTSTGEKGNSTYYKKTGTK